MTSTPLDRADCRQSRHSDRQHLGRQPLVARRAGRNGIAPMFGRFSTTMRADGTVAMPEVSTEVLAECRDLRDESVAIRGAGAAPRAS